ncbi:P-loop NTPase fold protein [Bacillus wiedmannii]|uniref:P-loop NTPase fold protein n=1 Tax=Bacillus wiedmannii TaxID=1890302 RepID=UPI002E1F15B6|nr:P-loop NTPase fold protein [Bacillus wiedmannii]
MKIEVDIKQIKDAPIENATSLDKTKIDMLKQELIMGNPTTYLVSGYRGVGKTSFIRTLVNEINLGLDIRKLNSEEYAHGDNNFLSRIVTKFKRVSLRSKKIETGVINKRKKIFIHLNVGKYNSFSNILRSLIREVFWALNNGDEELKKILSENPKLFSEIKLIYTRTFEDVELKESDLENEEIVKSFLFSANLRTLIIRIATFLLGSISFINYIKSGHWSSYIVPISILVFLLFSFEYSNKKSRAKNKELSRKTFYDDEVAEFQLTRVISKLDEIGIEIVFIIDELDKIEKEEDINSLVSELKPLMLMGKSNYILIFGQKMLYKYLMADALDNNILASIFTRNIHIPLLNKSGFEEYFISLIGEENYKNDIVKKYLDSKILLSNRIFRKFISIIRNDIRFDEQGKTYIEINEHDEVLLTNATISSLLHQVEEEITVATEGNIEEGVKDFLVSNLYIAIKNMKRMRPISFEIDDILKNKNFTDDEFASAYLNYIRKNIQSTIDKMLEVNLLEVVEDLQDDESVGKVRYKWTEKAALGKIHSNPYAYLDEFIRFERWLRELFYQVQKYILKEAYVKTNSLMQIFKTLRGEGVLSEGIVEEFYMLNKVRNQIVHGEELTDAEKESLVTFSEDLRYFKAVIFEEVMISAVRAFNKDVENEVYSNKMNYNVDTVVGGVAFEFKIFRYEKGFEKFIGNIQPLGNINDLKEIRMVILLDGELDKKVIQNKVDNLIASNKDINLRVKVIERVEMFELQDFLEVR